MTNTRKLLAIGALGLGVTPTIISIRNSLHHNAELQKALAKDKDRLPPDFKFDDKRVKLLRTKKEVIAWADDPNNIPTTGLMNKLHRTAVYNAADSLDHNAFFIAPITSKGTPAVAVGKGKFSNRKVFDHEYGHFLDYQALKSKNIHDFHKKQQQRSGGYFKQLLDPTTQPTFVTERAAWDQTKHTDDDPVRKHALGTYRAASSSARNSTALALGWVGAMGIAKPANHISSAQLDRLVRGMT